MPTNTGSPLLNPVTGQWKAPSAGQTGMIALLRGIYIELRTQNEILAIGLNQDTLLDQLRADVTSTIPDATSHEYSDLTSLQPDPTD